MGAERVSLQVCEEHYEYLAADGKHRRETLDDGRTVLIIEPEPEDPEAT